MWEGDFMWRILKSSIYLIVIFCVSNTFTNTSLGFLSLSYFLSLGILSYEVICNDIKRGVL